VTVATTWDNELDVRACRELLATGDIGRVAVCTSDGPQILPVSYVVDGASLVFRTSPYGVLGRHATGSRIAFEVDDLERTTRSGWSVVAIGRGEPIKDPDELALLRAFRDPLPWSPGVRFLYLRLRWDQLTGRRVGDGPQS
jgi:nitroimidazol reductase NimA-like FMN-containing flavoprotein (pyridoxamine 5'-phosphate oxidase superfamily)